MDIWDKCFLVRENRKIRGFYWGLGGCLVIRRNFKEFGGMNRENIRRRG